jgi:squalene-hopene/tetraprenyl-beta-curcumene cyclase
VPFADRDAMLDSTCPDITGRVLEALCQHERSGPDRAIEAGVRYLARTQRPDGSWSGRWGVNHVYGTFLALRGLRAAGEGDREANVLRAGEWLRSIQNADGGWGESCASYDAGEFVPGPSTAPQTAWAVLGLLAAGDASSEAVNCGVRFLLERQREDGGWEEEQATATGSPRGLYLTHSLYSLCYPLLALGAYRRTHAPAEGADRP